MLRERLPTPSPPLLSLPNRRYSYLRCALERMFNRRNRSMKSRRFSTAESRKTLGWPS
jgi:hypothetical protein